MIIGITSHPNRDGDLYLKWATYARSGVDLYVILDRGTNQNINLRVIVGSAKEIPGYCGINPQRKEVYPQGT